MNLAHNLELILFGAGRGVGALQLFTSPLWQKKKPFPVPQAVPEQLQLTSSRMMGHQRPDAG